MFYKDGISTPDSISILLEYDGKQKAVFTGDTLFVGDCSRPDLRNDGGDAIEKVKSGAHITGDGLSEINIESLWTIDVRDAGAYRQGHLAKSIHLMEGLKFEKYQYSSSGTARQDK